MEYKQIPIDIDFLTNIATSKGLVARLVEGDSNSCKIVYNIKQDINSGDIYTIFEINETSYYISICTLLDANTAEVIIPPAALSVEGTVVCRVFWQDVDSKLTSPISFAFFFENGISSEVVEADNQLPILTQLIVDTQSMFDQFDYLDALATEVESDSAEVAQTYSDFLAQLGTDVATLTNGKLTASQIPVLALQDIFTVTDSAQITGLDAQMGDIALVIPVDIVEDFYILADSDPTVLDNWKKGGISYVAEAGHAVNADEAINATKINNKRLIATTQSEYDIAVLDPDTIYVVTPD